MSAIEWLNSLPGRGTIFIVLGVAVLTVPHVLPLAVAGLFFIEGVRHLWAEIRRLDALESEGQRQGVGPGAEEDEGDINDASFDREMPLWPDHELSERG